MSKFKFITEEDIRGNFSDYSLLNGSAGYLLLCHFANVDDNIIKDAIEKTVMSINERNISRKYSRGIAGLLWVLRIIDDTGERYGYESVINELHSLLIEDLEFKDFEYDLDFLHGISGVIHYVVEFGFDDKSILLIERYIKLLEDVSWKMKKGLAVKFYQNGFGKEVFDFGLSHGLSAIIQIVSRIVKRNILKKTASKLLNGYVTFLLSNMHEFYDIGSFFPYSLNDFGSKSRLAWCYGDIGIALAIWQAGDNIGNNSWKKVGEEILINSISRKLFSETFVIDPMVCHGTVGIATIYHRMWKNTSNQHFLKARNYWIRRTKDYSIIINGKQSYLYYDVIGSEGRYEYGLLEGIIGIELAFLQFESDVDIRWDKALLISS